MRSPIILGIVLAVALLLPVVANASITMEIKLTSSTQADIKVVGDDSATQGSFVNNPSQRWARIAFLNDATHVLFGTMGTGGQVWTYASSTMVATGGNVPVASGSSTDTVQTNLGGESKFILAMSLNPAVGHTITGQVSGVTLPGTWTWGAVGATGTLRWGQNNSGTSQQTTGSWIITPEPASMALLALGGVGLLLRKRNK